MPTVSWRSSAKAILSLVPTPSVEATRTGRFRRGGTAKRPAEPADAAEHPGAARGGGQGREQAHGLVAGGDVDTRLAIGPAFGRSWCALPGDLPDVAIELLAAILEHADLAVQQRRDAPQRLPQAAVFGAQPLQLLHHLQRPRAAARA